MSRLPIRLLAFCVLPAALSAQKGVQYQMKYGPFITASWEAQFPANNDALKGLAIRVPGEDGPALVLFDTELLRVAAVATDYQPILRGTPYDGAHGPVPGVGGLQILGTPAEPGWARDGSFADPRPHQGHGNLPKDWARYKGLQLEGERVRLRYEVGGVDVRETYDQVGAGKGRAIVRTIDVAPNKAAMLMRVGTFPGAKVELVKPGFVALRYEDKAPAQPASAQRGEKEGKKRRRRNRGRPQRKIIPGARATGLALAGAPAGVAFDISDSGMVRLQVPRSSARQTFKLMMWNGAQQDLLGLQKLAAAAGKPEPIQPTPGPGRWGAPIVTKGKLGSEPGPYQVDTLTVPDDKTAGSRMRLCGFDFFADGRLAISTWNGDVWIVSGIDARLGELKWQRFATGLHDPLGLKIVDGKVYAMGRAQITRLHDDNDDGEADRYECFNNDVLITKAFHEFAFDLQTDKQGNFYFSKGGPVNPGGRGFGKLLPHHGTVLKVSPDGSELSVFATGLRAPNGIGVSPDGIVTTGDNEGTWMPVCRLNWMRQGAFGGCMDTAHRDPKPKTYDLPLCFFPMSVDNSSGGQIWVDEDNDKWGPFAGDFFHLSYGKSTLYRVLFDEVDGVMQGGVTRMPMRFGSSAMRARWHPKTGQMFLAGFKGWQTNAVRMTALHRIRYTGKPVQMLDGIRTSKKGVALTFTAKLDKETAEDPESYEVEVWNYIWAKTYGSPEVSTINPDPKARPYTKKHDPMKVTKATLSADGKTVFLAIADMRPVMQMHIKFDVDTATGDNIRSEVHNTIHKLRDQ